jgi:multiple sugar transport system ATP-binding protein
MSYLSLKSINKIYEGSIQAVFDFDLDVEAGEFVVLVGPSGCGKSTVLRMIAGLEGKRINNLAPSDRDIAMVFQDYALYGNMTIYQNIAFSLTIRGEKEDFIHNRVMDVSKTVGLFEYLNRFPKALSGGQKQRVAMGRSIAKQAKVLLMDEPLSNLDAKLRQQTRKELAMLHRELNATIVYVTHDQVEAMTLATRIVVINEGRIQQIGTPYEIYHSPDNIFSASFLGTPTINKIRGIGKNNSFIGLNEANKQVLTFEFPGMFNAANTDGLVMGIRPENVYQGRKNMPGEYTFKGEVKTLELLGSEYYAGLDVGGNILVSRIPAREEIHTGTVIEASFNTEKVHFFDEKTGLRIKRDER